MNFLLENRNKLSWLAGDWLQQDMDSMKMYSGGLSCNLPTASVRAAFPVVEDIFAVDLMIYIKLIKIGNTFLTLLVTPTHIKLLIIFCCVGYKIHIHTSRPNYSRKTTTNIVCMHKQVSQKELYPGSLKPCC